jgi:hypothetical protein
MSADTRDLLARGKWTLLSSDSATDHYYHWGPDGKRHELVLVHDRAGHLHGWSHWISECVSLDQETGRHERLNEFLRSGDLS